MSSAISRPMIRKELRQLLRGTVALLLQNLYLLFLAVIAGVAGLARAAAVHACICILQLADLAIEPGLEGLRLVTALTQTAELEMSAFLNHSLKAHPLWRAVDLAIAFEL